MLETDIKALVAAGRSADREAGARRRLPRLREALSAGTVRAAEPDAASPAGWRVNTWVKQGILLGFRFGDMVDVSMDHGRLAVLRQGHAAAEAAGPRGAASASCPADRRCATARTRARRHLHAADVRQHRRVGRRAVAHRLARARRIVRAGRRARARQRRRADRRRHRAGRRAAGHRRRRSARRRQHRDLRRRGHQGARGDRRRHGADGIHAGLRPGARRRSSSRRPIGRSSFPKAPSSCPARARSPSGKGPSGGCRWRRRSS